ncbi:MAG: histidinol-phosphate transaminase [Acidobacteriota bacterium]|nr:histidinol-phosphate transaminase [Acidobacteriota bacterium]
MTKLPRLPDYLLQIQPYVPGKPIEEVERELGIVAIKLASNENPLGPSPLAVEAIHAAATRVHLYPDGSTWYLRERLAARLNVPADHLAFGAGSCELILLASHGHLQQGDEGLTSESTFPVYAAGILSTGARLVEVPLEGDAIDLEGIAGAVTPRTRVIYLANPNNPTGSWFTAGRFDALLAQIPEEILVVLDEAYYEYADQPGYSRSIDLVREGRNVLVLRTFSKVYGLAGLRLGYGIARPEIVAALDRVRHPFNTSSVAQAAALAALDDDAHVRCSLEMNRAGLAQLSRGLAETGVSFLPSVTNFILVDVGDGKAVSDAMLRLGVVVRPMDWMGIPQSIRVTVGTAEENRKFLDALARALAALREARVGGS